MEEENKNSKRDLHIEFVLIFILGILLGIAFKTEAVKKITIGFDDYKMKIARQDFDINHLQIEVSQKNAEESAKIDEDNATTQE